MTRHKKFLKSEKTKTKLKGAKLPKGLNVTKTEFKVRKIVIRDQIKDQPTLVDGTIVRSSIKDLLTKLQHHNAANRNDGLRHLKEIITNHPQETSKHLGAMLQGICQLALDIEKDVRRECFKALNLVFASQTPDLIAPFINVITSYLRCAMTHINIQIQEDSLSLLDCLLLYAPTLVATNSDTIFTCFLDMISKLRTESNPQRTLTVNLGRKQTNVKWRSKVLDRLLGILKAIVNNRKHAYKQTNFDDEQPANVTVDDAFKLPTEQIAVASGAPPRHQSIKFYFDENVDFSHSIVRKNLNRNCDLPLLFRKTGNSITVNASNLLIERDEGDKIQKHIDLLMPLLFETWMEVRPAKFNSSKTTAATGFDDEDICISNEAAATLKTTMEIIEQLLELIRLYDYDVNGDDLIKWFRRKYNQEFFQQFLNGFPYQQVDGFKGSKRKSKGMATEHDVHEAGGQKCVHQNLNISFVFWILRTNSPANQLITKKIIDFIKDSMVSLNASPSDIHQAICKVLRCILVENSAIHSATIDNVPAIRELLATVLETYQRGLFPKEIRTRIMIMLCDIVLDNKLYAVYGEHLFNAWLPTLPKLLCQPHISTHILKTFSHLARQKNPHFMKHLDVNQAAIIANLPHVQITGLENQADGKQEIINLFYWLEKWQPDQYEANQMHLRNKWPMMEKLHEIRKYH